MINILDASTKKIGFIFIKTLSIYAILSVFFYCYEGLIDNQGTYYSPFLDQYSIIKLMLNLLISPLAWILKMLGYAVSTNSPVIWIGSSAIRIFTACLGIQIMIGYVSLILGFPGKKKLLFLIIGILVIYLLNIGRMISILLTIEKYPAIVNISHEIFTYLSYIVIIALYYIWVKKYSSSKIAV
jgi:exosortase/archaeosortase family protein